MAGSRISRLLACIWTLALIFMLLETTQVFDDFTRESTEVIKKYEQEARESVQGEISFADNKTTTETPRTEARLTRPADCPHTEFFTYTDSMKELPYLRERFGFSLTPWKVQHDWNGNFSDPDVRFSMVVMVKSHVNHIWERRFARVTWAQQKYHNGVRMETIFIVGKAESPEMEFELLKENKRYGDLLQLDRKEEYKDVVLKTLAGMQYAGTHFPCDWIYTSADDDIMPNLTLIHDKIELWITNTTRGGNGSCSGSSDPLKIACGYGCVQHAVPSRNRNNKWFVSPEEFSHKIYPPYCKGAWYSMTAVHAWQLYCISRKYPIFWVDDVWITGSLRLKHIVSDPNYRCAPADMSQGLPVKTEGYRFSKIGTVDELLPFWMDYFAKNLMRKKRIEDAAQL